MRSVERGPHIWLMGRSYPTCLTLMDGFDMWGRAHLGAALCDIF